jgi:choline dehydrogenase
MQPNYLATEEDRRCAWKVSSCAAPRGHRGDAAVCPRRVSARIAATSDADLLDSRANSAPIFHPSGTCGMGSGPQAVVDDHLRVHGIAGLRVVDC